MAEKIIGQKWKVHDFETVAGKIPHDGEMMCIRHPDNPNVTVPLMGNGRWNVAALYDMLAKPGGDNGETECSCAGRWDTPYSNSQVAFDSSWVPYKYHNTGIEIEDAATYNVIISAMGGSMTGATSGSHNVPIPVLLCDGGELYAHIVDDAVDGGTLMMKAFYSFRCQYSSENDTENMLFMNSLLDIALGTYHNTQWPSVDRKTAASNSWDNQMAQAAGPAASPIFVPKGKKLFIGVGLPEGESKPPDCSARLLVKVERLRGVEASA